MDGKIRAFICTEIPEGIRARMRDFQAGLEAARNVPVANMHITLLFLGDVEPREIERISLAMDSSAAPGFEISMEGIGEFRHGGNSVVFAGVARGSRELTELRNRICDSLGMDAGSYVPHATIARAAAKARLAYDNGVRFGSFTCRSIKLKSSTLGDGPPTYSDIHETRLY